MLVVVVVNIKFYYYHYYQPHGLRLTNLLNIKSNYYY